MEEKNRKNKIKIFVAIVVLVVVVAFAAITACILHAKNGELENWEEKNNQIPPIETAQVFEKF